jgi:hypothetical protein
MIDALRGQQAPAGSEKWRYTAKSQLEARKEGNVGSCIAPTPISAMQADLRNSSSRHQTAVLYTAKGDAV